MPGDKLRITTTGILGAAIAIEDQARVLAGQLACHAMSSAWQASSAVIAAPIAQPMLGA